MQLKLGTLQNQKAEIEFRESQLVERLKFVRGEVSANEMISRMCATGPDSIPFDNPSTCSKLGCVVRMVVDSILLHAESGQMTIRNTHPRLPFDLFICDIAILEARALAEALRSVLFELLKYQMEINKVNELKKIARASISDGQAREQKLNNARLGNVN